ADRVDTNSSCSTFDGQHLGQAGKARLRGYVCGHAGKFFGAENAGKTRHEHDRTTTPAHQLESLAAAEKGPAQSRTDLLVPFIGSQAGERSLDHALAVVLQLVQ